MFKAFLLLTGILQLIPFFHEKTSEDVKASLTKTEELVSRTHDYAEKSYLAEDFKDAEYFAHRAMLEAQKAKHEANHAKRYAEHCGCEDALKEANEAKELTEEMVIATTQAYYSIDLETSHEFAHLAMEVSEKVHLHPEEDVKECE